MLRTRYVFHAALLACGAVLAAAPVAAQTTPPRYACTALPVASPPLTEQLRLAEANFRSTQPLFALAFNLEHGAEGHDRNWALAAEINKLIMERTGNLPHTSLGARTWESAAEGLIRMYRLGLYGLPVDFAEAYRIIRLKEARGLPVAEDYAATRRFETAYQEFLVGVEHLGSGRQVAARDPLMRAGEGGYGRASALVGRIYFEEGRYDQAMLWFDKSAGAGDPEGYFLLGDLLFSGRGSVAAQPKKAAGLIYTAASSGHPLGMLVMGDVFKDGIGIASSNRQEALCWYRRAAQYAGSEEVARQYALKGIAELNALGVR